MHEQTPTPKFDDTTRAELIDSGVDVEGLETIAGEIIAGTVAQEERVRTAIKSGDLSSLSDDDLAVAMKLARKSYDQATPDEQAKILKRHRTE